MPAHFPARISAADLLELVEEWHHTPEDLADGDLGERVWRFDEYRLGWIPIERIHLNEWTVREELVSRFRARLARGEEAPPIVFDPVEDSVIDGINRANALAAEGRDEVMAYIGVGEPNPTEDDAEDDWLAGEE
jgi:hypothetical protein